ncbi:MAG: glycosyltransferase family 2 protein [Paludibacteraceae bacterium]|nr:glycosyltransferase family 2 protein [Paludibacteraceae bacterium]
MISVIIPIYNAMPYLYQCLESVRTQTYSDLEIIMIDDCSTDRSAELAAQFCEKDNRFRLLRHTTNKGQSAARNRGLAEAKGEWISFIDADDYIEPDFYSLMADSATADVVQGGYKRFTNDGNVIKTYIPRTPFKLTSMCLRLIKRGFIERNSLTFPEGQIYEDVLFSADMWLAQPTYQIVKYAGYNYRQNPASTTSATRNTNLLFKQMNSKRRNATTVFLFLLISYTILRLRMHFLLKR